MTGIERLRALAGAWDEWGLGGTLAEMADEIDRELREAMGGEEHELAADVSMSAYDLLPNEERDAIAWVRSHGGLDHVRAEWRSRVPYDRYERRRQSLLDHIAECETALGRRNRRIEELGHRVNDLTNENAELRRRAMPEGCEWPLCEDGEPVRFGDDVSRYEGYFEVNNITLYRDGSFALNFWPYSKGERVKRPAPAVLTADGESLEAGQTVYEIANGKTHHVTEVDAVSKRFRSMEQVDGSHWLDPMCFTHQRPEVDSWSRLEEDAKLSLCEYNLRHKPAVGDGTTLGEDVRVDLVRRCRALAERERGE